MKKRLLYLVLTLLFTTSIIAQGVSFEKPKNELYEVENIEEISARHKKIAVLPFKTLIVYQHPEVRAESQLEQLQNQQKLSYMWQIALYERFVKRSKRVDVEIQDVQETNKVLKANDYFKNFKNYTPADLCKMLGVDALVFSTYDLSLNNDESTILGSGLAIVGDAMLDTSSLNSGLIKELISDPGEFVNKLKSGDLTQLVSIAATAMGADDGVRRIMVGVAANSGTIIKLAQGDTSNLLQDILVNNADLIGEQIGGGDGQLVSNLIKKNAPTLQNFLDGNTENLISDLVASNLSVVAEKFGGADGAFISKAISNNSNLIKNVLNGDTSNLFQQILANNADLIGAKIGGSNAQLYTNLILNNQNLISDISSGNTAALFQNIVANNLESVGGLFGSGEIAKYTKLISENKELVQGLMQGDLSQLQAKLMEQGSELVGAQLNASEIGDFSTLLTGNKDLVQSFINGDTSGIVNQALTQAPDLLGTSLDLDQIQQFSSLVGGNKDLVGNLASGNVNGILGGAISKISSGKLNISQTQNLGNLLTANPGLLGLVSTGNTAELTSKLQKLSPEVNQGEISQYTDFLINNKTEVTKLFEVNVSATEIEKARNFLNPEMIAGLSRSYGTDENFIAGMLSGKDDVMVDQILRSEEMSSFGMDKGMMTEIAGLFTNKRSQVAEIIAGGAVDFFEVTGDLNEDNFNIEIEEEGEKKKKERLVLKNKKFFNKVTDFAIHKGSSGKKNTSERIGNFMSGSEGDIGKVSFSLFDGQSGGLMWNFVDVENNTNVYDLEKSLNRFAKKFLKKLPYSN